MSGLLYHLHVKFQKTFQTDKSDKNRLLKNNIKKLSKIQVRSALFHKSIVHKSKYQPKKQKKHKKIKENKNNHHKK